MFAAFARGRLLSPRIRPLIAGLVLALAAAFTLFGLHASIRFDQTATAQNAVPVIWPPTSALTSPSGRPELLVFVHPFCSCSAATIAELAKLSTERGSGSASPMITILFIRPYHSNWARRNALWNEAGKLAGVRVMWDEGGGEARRFGAKTSGFVVLYSSQGKLLFSGGVTGSRGHQGDNYGLDQLRASIESQRKAIKPSLVFGCALEGSGRSPGI